MFHHPFCEINSKWIGVKHSHDVVRASTDEMKILRDTQEHLTILVGRTLPVSMLGGCWTCTTITTVSLRDVKTHAALVLHSKITVRFQLHEGRNEISIFHCVIRT